MNIGVAGQFELHVYDETGELREHRPMQPNLITDTGLMVLMLGRSLIQCILGGGDSEPQKADTKLTTPLPNITYERPGAISPDALYDKDGQYYSYNSALFRARNTGTATATVKELGLQWVGGGLLATHALITRGGILAPITLQPGWYLDVTYELRAYYNKAPISKDVEFTVGNSKKTYHTRTITWPHGDGSRLLAAFHPANFRDSYLPSFTCYAYATGLNGDKPPAGGSSVTVVEYGRMYIPHNSVVIRGDAAVVDLPIITMREETNISGGKVMAIGLFGGALMSHAIEFKDDAGEGIPKDELSAIDFRFRYTVSRYGGTLEERA